MDGVQPAIICDNANEMVQGKFNRKLKETSCYLKTSQPFTPWTNVAEREMTEHKKGSGRMIIKSNESNRL